MKSFDSIQEVKALTLAIQKLPPFQVILLRKLSVQQEQIWQHKQNYWKRIGQYIDYLQLDELGYKPINPLNSANLHPAFKELISINAEGFLAELNVMNAGWELIKKYTREKKIKFNFDNPRQMLAERCRKLSVTECQYFLSTEGVKGDTLEDVRAHYKYCSSFMRNRLEEQEEKEAFSALLNSGDLFGLTVCAIWEHKLDRKYDGGKLKRAWEDFLKSFKKESAMWCKKDYFLQYEAKLSALKWSDGKPILAQGNNAAYFS